MNDEQVIESLPTLLELIEDNKKKSRLSAENTTVQISLATIYDISDTIVEYEFENKFNGLG